MEFLEIGTEGFPIQDLTHAVTVTDEFMNEMIAGDEAKRAIWAKVIQRRGEIGYPYIMFHDTMNNKTVDVYKTKVQRFTTLTYVQRLHFTTLKKSHSFVYCHQ
jgi:ribonucleoside-diphosphate reductase alpha chain